MKSNRFNVILSLVAAIALWAYVLGGLNPSTTQVIRNIPITFTNEASLTENGLVVLEKNLESINITISRKRSATSKVKAENFKVMADLEGLKNGENVIRLSVEKPDEVSIESVSSEKVTVTIDNLVSVDKTVKPIITNDTSDDTEPAIVQLSREKVTVSGAESLVNQIQYLAAYIDASKVSNQMKALTVELIPEDKNGEKVDGVKLSQKSISVTTITMSKKTVPLSVPISGQDHSILEREVSVPKTITIKGPDEKLEAIDSVDCEKVDLTEVFETTTIALTPILPDGVSVASDSGELVLYATVTGAESTKFTFDENDIVMEGVTEDLIPTIASCKVTVTATGKASVVSELDSSDFTLSADVSELDEGKHTVAIVCKCKKTLADIEVSPAQVSIDISQE